jgi:thiol-disulfide isomerase/thioredoxin
MFSARQILITVVSLAALAGAAALTWHFTKRASVASNFAVQVQGGVTPPKNPGEKIPQFQGITLSGQNFKLNPAATERTLIVFWASWCPPCAEETPALIDLAKRHTNWNIVAVSNDSTEREIRDFFKIFPNLSQPNISVVWDLERQIANAYGVTGLPESFLVDQKGLLLQKFIGPVDWRQF